MATSASRARADGSSLGPRGVARWLRHAWVALFVGVAALVAGTQVAAPKGRTLQVIAAALLAAIAVRVSSFTSLLFLVVAVPFPKVTSYGTTTLAFVVLIFILWVARLTLRIEKPAGRSAIDLPVLTLLMAYLLSFAQFDSPAKIYPGLIVFFNTVTQVFLGYLLIHLTRTEKQLRQLIAAILTMAVLVHLTAIHQLAFPTRALVPGWIDLENWRATEYAKEGLEIKNLRVGGSIGDYELLAEFAGMMVLLLWFVLMRTRGAWARAGVVALLVLDVFVMLATVTRGAIVALAIAAAYLAWQTRRRIRFHVFVIGLALVLGGGTLVFNFVAFHTRSGNIAERMEETTFEGAVPENRVIVWTQAWEYIMKQPFTGYGPFYGTQKGLDKIYWPHNVFLFYWYLIGLPGLAAFLWLLAVLWRETKRAGPHLGHPSYAAGLLLALRAMLLLFIIDEIKVDYPRNATYSYWVWLFFALIVVTARIAREQEKAATAPPEGATAPPSGRPRRLPAVSTVAAV